MSLSLVPMTGSSLALMMAQNKAQMMLLKMLSSQAQIMLFSLASKISSSWVPMTARSSYNDGTKLSKQWIQV
eukprot:437948-Ditylum_brightwellii.AAC.1